MLAIIEDQQGQLGQRGGDDFHRRVRIRKRNAEHCRHRDFLKIAERDKGRGAKRGPAERASVIAAETSQASCASRQAMLKPVSPRTAPKRDTGRYSISCQAASAVPMVYALMVRLP